MWQYLAEFFLEWETFPKICRENQNTHFMFNNFFPKIVPFMRWCRKIRWSHRGRKWQCGACALHAGLVRVHISTHTPAPCTHTHPRSRTHAHTHTHTQKYVILFVFPWKVVLWRASVLRYTYAACHVGSQSSVRIAWHLRIQQWLSSGTWQKNTDNLQDPVVSCMRIYRHLSSSPRYQNSRESGTLCQTISKWSSLLPQEGQILVDVCCSLHNVQQLIGNGELACSVLLMFI